MSRRTLLLVLTPAIAVLAALFPACDELITEVTEVTIAGHPVAVFEADKTTCCVPCTVVFTDNSRGRIHQWTWFFGDGDSLIINDSLVDTVMHVYSDSGLFTVSLKVVDTVDGGEDVEVRDRLLQIGTIVSDFTVSDTIACPDDSIHFTPVNAVGVTELQWNFGDGVGTSSDSTPAYAYTDTGAYEVTLSIKGPCTGGNFVPATQDTVQIVECPVVQFVMDTTLGCVPMDVSFFDSSTPPPGEVITEWQWDFGDGSVPDTMRDPDHTYDSAGIYTVSLTVTASNGGKATDSRVDTIVVHDTLNADFTTYGPLAICKTQYQALSVKFEPDWQPLVPGSLDSLVWRFVNTNDTTIDSLVTFKDTAQTPGSIVFPFVNPGVYDVELLAYGFCGSASVTRPSLVSLSDTLTAAIFTIDPDTLGDTNTTFTFTDASPGVILDRTWVFDPGSADPIVRSGVSELITFSDTGYHVITLTVSNDCGSVETRDSVHVVAP
ncbi:MAG: PKD domain-containing protein [Candidatus Zixiibacteriota bacterium]